MRKHLVAETPPALPFHTLTVEETLSAVASDGQRGLDSSDAQSRLRRHGPNSLPDREGRSKVSIALDQVRSAMTVMLIIAALVSMGLSNTSDALVILAIVVLNIVLGFVQDYRAEHAMASLRRLSAPHARVRRSGMVQQVPADQVVVGDVLLLQAGDRISADGRVMFSEGITTSEATLSGESLPCEKQTHALANADLALSDRTNMCFRGTVATHGHGLMVVTATGLATEVGRIASLLHSVERSATPMQQRLSEFGRKLALLSLSLVVVVVLVGLLGDASLVELVVAGLSLAVAAVPEGLPTVATVALALGARRMLKRNTLVRKLPAVETMGAVTVICTDKTGTLTQNEMAVTSLALPLSAPVPLSTAHSSPSADIIRLMTCNLLCNDAKGELEDVADPTELALLQAARTLGLSMHVVNARWPRIASIPFDSHRMRMTTVHQAQQVMTHDSSPQDNPLPHVRFACIKGSLDAVLACCDKMIASTAISPLDDAACQQIRSAELALAESGMRVLATALRPIDDDVVLGDNGALESHAILLGLVAMEDPLRPEAKAAIERCTMAGIRTVMITGDHPRTARAIGKRLGLPLPDGALLTGPEVDGLDDAALQQAVAKAVIFARVTPSHKLRIVSALQQTGEVVAMTGDGVNDAPALKRADIGIAMGKKGTDVAREAADTVLLDDNFATIVHAVEDGRTIYSNVRKFLRYTMTSNAGEIATMLLGTAVFSYLPLLPLQILWINLVTDGLPGLALAMEPMEEGTMARPPRSPSAPLVDGRLAIDITWIGLLMSSISLGVAYLLASTDETRFRTVVFTILAFSQMGNALAVRSERQSLWRIGFGSNRLLSSAIVGTVLLQLALLYYAPFSSSFHIAPLTTLELIVCIVASTGVFAAVEVQKALLRRTAVEACGL